MTFSPDEMSGGDDGAGDDGGPMEFGVIDTEEAAREVERSRQEEIDLIRVVQRRPFLRRNRVEFAPFLGTNVNDALVSMFVAGGTLNYHLTEVMAIGVNGGYSLGSETDLFDQVVASDRADPVRASVLVQQAGEQAVGDACRTQAFGGT